MKYVIDLEGCGHVFFEMIRNLGIGVRPPYNPKDEYENQKYVYNESASQIATIVTADMQTFLNELQKLPNPVYFEHLDDFNNPQVASMFTNAFREFALRLYAQINAKVGLRIECDYLLEAIAPDYAVICVVNKY